jgi:IstB-like ATP binding protein
VFLGSPGTGKTHLAIGLGIRACQAGHGVALVWRCYCGKQGTMRDGVSRPLMTTAAPPRPSDDARAVALTTSEAA